MNQIKLFIELTRLKKPIGYMLLFWPCAWGLTLAYDFSSSWDNYFFYLILFFLGAVLMRSAGCIVNDILDRKFDAKVFRTKDRPIASGKISVKLAIVYSIILCLLAFLVLINFNLFTIILALGSMPLAFTYPLMKRFTYWPQLFLGITFNYGLILGWTAIKGQIDIIPILFYLGAIFWTLGYDTIYGFQDIKDDEIIGLKSTSIKFKGNAKKFLFLCYSILIVLFVVGGLLMSFNYIYFILSILSFVHLFLYQMKIFNFKDPKSCLNAFKSNNLFGAIIFINILISQNF
ncbi:4-hydroxybenzoate octaprenyltransferase [Candidatus Pelagibacter sp. HIMB1611]|uniref:4-hydroxybenzoate octaprenyltransferase n=1 Tax=unclassified Candidatus Pelagibacter TaxID=2647897 RepID=UPI003F828D73